MAIALWRISRVVDGPSRNSRTVVRNRGTPRSRSASAAAAPTAPHFPGAATDEFARFVSMKSASATVSMGQCGPPKRPAVRNSTR